MILRKKQQLAAIGFALAVTSPLMAQNPSTGNTFTSATAMQAWQKGIMVPFDWNDEGQDFSSVQWGIDTAWLWDWWHLRTVSFMQDYATIGRITIDPRTSGSYTELSTDQKKRIDDQLSWLSGAKKLKSLFILGGISGQWGSSDANTYANDMVLAAQYVISKGYKVVALTPFNEPDYQGPYGYDPLNTVAAILKNNATVTANNIYIAGPSCLSSDASNNWWWAVSGNFTMGNTHQLGGNAANFANFYQQVANSGKPAAGDEMHTVNDALMGMQYGMDYGIWWSDHNASGYAQAELGRAAQTSRRIAYSEDRNAFASAAVFKNNTDKDFGEAFAATSERQGGTSAFTYVSKDRLVYFDGHGPLYDYSAPVNGGYSESVTELSYGEDVPETTLDGTFKLVNKATGKLLTSTSNGLSQSADNNSSSQKWTIKQLPSTNGGDRNYATVALYGTGSYLDAPTYSHNNGSTLQVYGGGGNANELWHFRYMGDGYYLLTNHHTGLNVEGSSDGTEKTSSRVTLWERTGSDRQLWKLIPADGSASAAVPVAPTNLKASANTASITLSWDAVDGAYSYNVYRYNDKIKMWETIGRNVKATTFIDNISSKTSAERYRVRALSGAWVKGEPSAEVSATVKDESGFVGHWTMYNDMKDATDNHLDGAATGVTFGSSNGMPSATFNGSTGYAALPYKVADMKQMTFAAWVYPTTTSAWQRIFDFGNSTSDYLFLTPSNGSAMRFEICHNGTKQGLNATQTLPVNTWSHVALTIGADRVCLYVNGKLNVSTKNITFRPSDFGPKLSYLGRSMFDGDPTFNGSLSDVRIYNYAISADEEQKIYYQSQLELKDNISSMPMNKDVLSAYNKAYSAAKTAQDNSSADVSDKFAALATAQTNAFSSIAAYKKALTSLNAEKRLLGSTNFYSTEAREAYGYDSKQKKYDDRTLTDDEANAIENPLDHSIGYQVDNATNTLLLDAWGGKQKYGANNLYLNTWSTESEGNNAGFQAPFIEDWTWDTSSLNAKTLTATLTGIAPGVYSVSLKVRSRMKNDGGTKPQGITISVNDGSAMDANAGTAYTADNGTWTLGQYTAVGEVGSDGKLTLNVNIASGNNVSWLAMKDVVYAKRNPYYVIDEATNNDSTVWSVEDNDECSLNAIKNVSGVKVLLKRTLNTSQWNTLVLPFDVSNDQLKEVFGKNVVVAAYSGSKEVATDRYEVYFDETINDIKANTPVLIRRVKSGQKEWWFENVDVKTPEELTISDKGPVAFTGIYTTDFVLPVNTFNFVRNRFSKSKGTTKIQATRGYFTINGADATNATLTFEVATDISAVKSEEGRAKNQLVYNLSGQRVGKDYKGIVIKNGKKVMQK